MSGLAVDAGIRSLLNFSCRCRSVGVRGNGQQFTHAADRLDAIQEVLARAPLMGVRDVLFLVVNQSWLGAMQATGLVMLCVAVARLQRDGRLPRAAWFWLWQLVGTALCLSFSHPAVPDFGLAHIGLLPLILLVPAWIAAAWPTLSTAADAFVAVSDEAAMRAVQTLASGADADPRIVAGPSGACGLAALRAVMADPGFAAVRDAAGLGAQSSVLVINTEGP